MNDLNKVEADLIKQEKEQTNMLNQAEYENYTGEDEVISNRDMARLISETVGKAAVRKSGMAQLDAMLGDFEDGELIVISGITGNGKTLLAKTLTRTFQKNDSFSLWFTYEESPRYFLSKFPPQYLPIFYLPKKNISSQLDWIKKRIIESTVKYKTKIVFIDHLHFLISLKEYINTSLLIGAIMRELKRMAIELDVIMFLLAHTQKIKQNERPDISHLRDSGFIGCEADKVMIIRRDGKEFKDGVKFTDYSELFILKNRSTGELGKIILKYNPEEKIFRESTVEEYKIEEEARKYEN